MRHKNDCGCINCEAKGKPILEIYLANVTIEELTQIEVCDWMQGFGHVGSLAEQTYIRKYGFMLIKLQKESLKQHNMVTDHYNLIINGLNHDNHTQVNRLKANRKIIDELQVLKISNEGYKTTIQDLETQLKVALVENQRLADLQKEL